MFLIPPGFSPLTLNVPGGQVAVMHPKRKKDLRQASQLLSVLIEERPMIFF